MIELMKDAIIIDLTIESNETEAKEILEGIIQSLGKEKFDLVVHYMLAQVAYKLITDEGSPLLLAMNEALSEMNREVDSYRESTRGHIQELKEENSRLRINLADVSGKVSELSSALTFVRKRLKHEDTKSDLNICQKIRRDGILSDSDHLAVRLGEVIKDICIAIRNV